MANREVFEHDIESTPVLRNSQSANPLIRHGSEGGLKEELGRKSDSDQASLKPLQSLPSRRSNARFEGWKFTIFLAFITSVVVLSFNVGFLLYTVTHSQRNDIQRYSHQYQVEYYEHGKHHGRNTVLYEGDCEKVHHLGIGIHLLINVLSTSLLSASNYGMQCLAAPTRQAIDRAHQKKLWLDIGVPSVRNIFRVSRWRSILWLCLAFSSLPFHLIYNSAIYETTAVSAYDIFGGSGSLAQKNWPDLKIEGEFMNSTKGSSLHDLFYAARNGTVAVNHLNNNECLDAFGKTYQSSYNKLLLINDGMKENNTYTFVGNQRIFNPLDSLSDAYSGPYEWLCPSSHGLGTSTCKGSFVSAARSKIADDNWIVDGLSYKVDSCLAKKAPQYCKLQYSLPLTLIVVCFNIVKSTILLYMWLRIPDAPILTIGDAIASFLRRPDPHTQGFCLLTHQDVEFWELRQHKRFEPQAFPQKRARWGLAVSYRRWISSIVLWVFAIFVCIGFLVYGLGDIGSGIDIWNQQLGAIIADTLIKGENWPTSLVPNIIIANSPQLIFSFLCFSFNAVLTAMTLAAEWSSYAIRHKGLRVSNNPQLSQRSNYFLSIPYRYSMPLLAMSGILHWLISQSLFMVGIEAFDSDMVRNPGRDLVTCGFSPVAILVSILVGTCMFLCLVGLSYRRFESAMPVAGSCSLAISAACHPRFDPHHGEAGDDIESEDEDEDMALLPVRWGVVSVKGRTGHCSFTSAQVNEPEKEVRYL